MSAPRRIGLFGGTFDPVHLGHLHLANLARESLALDEVRFIPCTISPHKLGSNPASPADRLKMLRLATADLPWAVIDDTELKSSEPNYSYRTAELIHKKFPEAHLFWIMGGDQWQRLPTWKNPEKLAELVDFVVLARNDSPLPRDGYRLHLIQGEHAASSTTIRNQFSKDHLSPAVADWIIDRKLYQNPDHKSRA